MARYTGPKNRLARKIGEDLGLKTNFVKLEKRLKIKPGQHGAKGTKGKISNYGIQLREKQKVCWTYGLMEKQFRTMYTIASKDVKATGLRLLQLLELRLDNVVYRLGFAPTRAAARQMVAHGHVLVNDKKLDIPSYRSRFNDVISLDAKISATPVVKQMMANTKVEVPAWLEKQANAGKVLRDPIREEMDKNIEEHLIVEFYSK